MVMVGGREKGRERTALQAEGGQCLQYLSLICESEVLALVLAPSLYRGEGSKEEQSPHDCNSWWHCPTGALGGGDC